MKNIEKRRRRKPINVNLETAFIPQELLQSDKCPDTYSEFKKLQTNTTAIVNGIEQIELGTNLHPV